PPSPDYTLATPYTDDESKPYETSDTMVTSSPSPTPSVDLTSRPSPSGHYLPRHHLPLHLHDYSTRSTAWMVVHTQPTLSLGYSAKLTETMALSPSLFCTSELIVDTETKSTDSKDESTESDDVDTAPEVKQQQAILAEDTAEDDPFGLVRSPVQTSRSSVRPPTSPEWFSESLPVSPANPLSVASPVPVAALDEVRKEIHSQRFRLKSLERVQEETGITIGALWRLILALKAWAGHTDSQRGALWQARYEDRCDNRQFLEF
nr:hypothetical protein [Tanacetum cinerariifolium]